MLKIGDTLMLEPKYSNAIETYKCKLVERIGSDLYIDYPVNTTTKRTVFLIDGTQLKVTFVGEDGSVYLFESEIRGRVKQNIPMLILSYPEKENLIKIQRRQYVRVETPVDVAVHPLNGEFQPFTAVTEDISAGGAAAILTGKSEVLREGMIVEATFVLPFQSGEYHYKSFKSRVVRVEDVSENRKKISLQFTDITGQDRQLLLRFCFERQLDMKKKGFSS
ncbi:pilus assembly protein PilZ [Bacillus methanolicus]|uniref:flagellar brake protein n=1 Tax=Bacillus methanolicus TaxID=1471 RepID=UPI0023802280|nr:flagellar brake domain-containing protein [Bacillus methanolicus]MDE3839423.1 pilus assembly protein PilZ [Bacillus methanolicus]